MATVALMKSAIVFSSFFVTKKLPYVVTRDVCPSVRPSVHPSVCPSVVCRNIFETRLHDN